MPEAPQKSPVRRMTRLTVVMVATGVVTVGILAGVWFAAPGLLARKAAHRVSLGDGALRVDKLPVQAMQELFESNTMSHNVTQRQLRMAFRGAEGTLEGQLGQMPLIVTQKDAAGRKWLCAYWALAGGYVELVTGSAVDGDLTRLRVYPGAREAGGVEEPASIDDVKTIYTR